MKNFFAGFSHIFRRRHSLYRRHPRHDWLFMLRIALVAAIFVIAADAYMFHRINTRSIFEVDFQTEVKMRTLRRQALDETVDLFKERDQAFQAIAPSSVTVVDPSL